MSSFLTPFQGLFAGDPAVQLLQAVVLSVAAVLIFLLFWTLKDAILRSKSFWFQLLSIALVTLLPLFGWLAYLLIRPAQTLKEKEMERLLHAIHKELSARVAKKPKAA